MPNSSPWAGYEYNNSRYRDNYKMGGIHQAARGGYETSIPEAYKRYMSQIYGKGGTEGYIKGQVQGASDAINPYMEAMKSSGAASIGARGGLGGGAQDAYSSALTGQKVGVLGQAAAGAQQNVTQTGQNVMGMAQNEQFQLTQDELNKFLAQLQKQQVDFNTRDPQFWDYLNNILQAGASGAGAYFGGRGGG